MPFQIYNYIHPRIQCAKCDLNQFSRYAALRMREKACFGVRFFTMDTGHTAEAIVTLNSSIMTCFATVSAFWGSQRYLAISRELKSAKTAQKGA